MNKPNVFIPGFGRCGSEYVFRILNQHPAVCIPQKRKDNKEIGFHQHNHFYYEKPHLRNPYSYLGIEWYHGMFDDRPIKIDMTINLAYDKTAPERIKELYGDIPIVFLTRKKGYKESYYRLRRIGYSVKRTLTYKDFLEKYKDDIDYYSDFERHIKRWKKHFSRVLVADVVDGDSKEEVQKITKFLGLNDFDYDFDVFKNGSKMFLIPTLKGRMKHKILIWFPRFHRWYVKQKVRQYANEFSLN